MVEVQWDNIFGKNKLYIVYIKEMSGDDIGIWFMFDIDEGEMIEVSMGVLFVSIVNVCLNLEKEQVGKGFDQICVEVCVMWQNDFLWIFVEGGIEEQKRVFYIVMYYLLIYLNILQDVNG